MTETIRDEIRRAWAGILTRAGADSSYIDVLLLELEQAAANRGVRLPQRPRADDPNAAGLQMPPPEAVRPARDSPHFAAARAALRPYKGVDRRAEHEPSEHLPEPPEEPAWPSP